MDQEAMHTYLIETTSDSTDTTTWKTAAIEINHLFLAAGVAQEDIEVEIVNASRSTHLVSSALPDEPALLHSFRT